MQTKSVDYSYPDHTTLANFDYTGDMPWPKRNVFLHFLRCKHHQNFFFQNMELIVTVHPLDYTMCH